MKIRIGDTTHYIQWPVLRENLTDELRYWLRLNIRLGRRFEGYGVPMWRFMVCILPDEIYFRYTWGEGPNDYWVKNTNSWAFDLSLRPLRAVADPEGDLTPYGMHSHHM